MFLESKDLTQTRQWLSESEREAILVIVQASFSKIEPNDYLAKYFEGGQVFERKLRLYFSEQQLVGYCLLTFTEEQDTTVIRASAGFLPDYRKGGNTFRFSLLESLKFWLRRPWRKLYYADTMLSPAMYRAIAKKTGIVWPHPLNEASCELFEWLNPNGKISPQNDLRCLVPVERVSNYSQRELESFQASDKPEIQYYCRVNSDFDRGCALFVIIPVNLKQLALTLIKNL
ncbi:hypothetical protein RCJ22_14795 [Vibrio sp. FNV 38]|nr:hypothetical protein [Vibrio sp. FNV 38]